MSKDGFLVFPFHALGGMTNLLMELEIRVILAALSNRTLVSLNKYPSAPQPEDHLYGRYREAALLDLYDIPVKHISMTKLYKRGFKELYFLPWQGDCASEAYFKPYGMSTVSDHQEADFVDGRHFCWQFPDNEADVWVAYNQKRTFCNSAYFFLASGTTKKKIKNVVKQIQPKQIYLDLAGKISKDLQNYNAIHVRLGDFNQWWINSPTAGEIVDNITSVFEKDKLLLICTDNYLKEDFFKPIIDAYPKHLFIDQFIMKEYKNELEALPHNDANVIALLSALVSGKSDFFAGSIYSTFTSAIHRRRLFDNPKSPILFTSNPFDDSVKIENCEFKSSRSGTFSWNRLAFPNPESARANAWLREWPETIS